MSEKNQQDTSSSGGTSDNSLLNTCEDVELNTDGADLIISVSGTNSFTAEVTVTGTNCQSAFTCIWDGQKWVCS